MMLYIYANYNNLGQFFGQPIICDTEPEVVSKDYVQMVCDLEQEALIRLKECDLYLLGSLDNVSGEVKPEKTFLLHCAEVVSRFIKVPEEAKQDARQSC